MLPMLLCDRAAPTMRRDGQAKTESQSVFRDDYLKKRERDWPHKETTGI